MTPRVMGTVACAAAACATAVLVIGAAHAQGRPDRSVLAPRSLAALRQHDNRIGQMLRGGELRLSQAEPDAQLPNRTVERAQQFHRGVRVFGGDVSRQLSGAQTVSTFGTLYENIDLETTPRTAEPQARAAIEARTGQRLGISREGELMVLPLDRGGYALAWRFRVVMAGDIREYFVDARTGEVVFEYSDLQTQNVGRGTGVNGDSKKVSARSMSGMFLTEDLLRPAPIRTYDMKGDPQRTINLLIGAPFQQSDFGADVDNVWTDGALVDAHVFSGLTYDYYFKRFGRRGINDTNLIMRTLVHPVRRDDFARYFPAFPEFFTNAFYAGDGYMVYGVGLPPGQTQGGRTWDFMSGALDVVAHEITHGVTEYSSDLIYFNESGALNESFSDIMGTAAEFFFQPAGDGVLRADYVLGEDVVRGAFTSLNGIRSMANPNAYGHPDHYSLRFLGGDDNGGVHINSSISNHAFYLAIEGGTHRVSGVTVAGVGRNNREQIEKVFYRAFTQMLTLQRDLLDGSRGHDAGRPRSLRSRQRGRAGRHRRVDRGGCQLRRARFGRCAGAAAAGRDRGRAGQRPAEAATEAAAAVSHATETRAGKTQAAPSVPRVHRGGRRNPGSPR